MAGVLTQRQLACFDLYYVYGWSTRKIASVFSCSYETVRRERDTVVIRLQVSLEDGKCDNTLRVEDLFRSSSSTPTRDVGAALRRQEQLASELESWMDIREQQLLDVSECMDGNCPMPAHHKKNPYDQWELDYMLEHHRKSMTTADYEARRLGRYAH